MTPDEVALLPPVPVSYAAFQLLSACMPVTPTAL
jgi:hypothetical protein